MGSRGQIIFGLFLMFLGAIYLLGVVFDFDIGVLCWPIFLILLGVWLLARPSFARQGAHFILLGSFRREGVWPVESEDIWLGVGDVHIDLSQAVLPIGETLFRVNGFVGDVVLSVPAGTAVSVRSNAFVTDANIFGKKTDNILTPVHFYTPGYEQSDRKVRLESTHFVGEIKVR